MTGKQGAATEADNVIWEMWASDELGDIRTLESPRFDEITELKNNMSVRILTVEESRKTDQKAIQADVQDR